MNKKDKATWAREYRKTNKEAVAKSKLKSKNKNKQKHSLIQRKTDLKRRFGITLEEYDALRELQNNKCAICLKEFDAKPGPCVDHCHESEKSDKIIVRGLLCRKCNLGLGHLGDNLECLERAVNYLKKTYK